MKILLTFHNNLMRGFSKSVSYPLLREVLPLSSTKSCFQRLASSTDPWNKIVISRAGRVPSYLNNNYLNITTVT